MKKHLYDESVLRELFKDNSDIIFESIHFHNHTVLLIYSYGMVDSKNVKRDIPIAIEQFLKHTDHVSISTLQNEFHSFFIDFIDDTEDLLNKVFNGYVLVLFQDENILISINCSNKPNRTTEASNMEIAILGPRDNLIEDITTNFSLIRKRLPTNSLLSKTFKIGERSKTEVKILYMKDITNEEIVKTIEEKLKKIKVENVYSGKQLMEFIDKKVSFFPRYDYTGRPDYIVQSLLTGRVAILIDGIPFSIITPANLFLLFKSAEDVEYTFFYNIIERFFRITGFMLSILLPGFWVAITSFHQDQLPLSLLATVVESRSGIPLSPALEAFIMLFLFELFREAGLRLPTSIGQTLSVVGGLIIGDAAIRAGIASPAMIVIMASSVVAGFTLINQTLIGALTILRFFVLILSSLLGFFGFFLSIFFFGLYLSSIRIYGIPYLAPFDTTSGKSMFETFFKVPFLLYNKRPRFLSPKDETRIGDQNDEK